MTFLTSFTLFIVWTRTSVLQPMYVYRNLLLTRLSAQVCVPVCVRFSFVQLCFKQQCLTFVTNTKPTDYTTEYLLFSVSPQPETSAEKQNTTAITALFIKRHLS